jgi:hypothetical protein
MDSSDNSSLYFVTAGVGYQRIFKADFGLFHAFMSGSSFIMSSYYITFLCNAVLATVQIGLRTRLDGYGAGAGAGDIYDTTFVLIITAISRQASAALSRMVETAL